MNKVIINPKDDEFYFSGYKFYKKSEGKLKVISTSSSEFFKKDINKIHYIILGILFILFLVPFFVKDFFSIFSFLNFEVKYSFWFSFLLFLSIPSAIVLSTRSYKDMIQFYFSSEGIEIESIHNSNKKIFINIKDIKNIYIKNIYVYSDKPTKDEQYVPGYSIILELKNPIYLSTLKKEKKELTLLDGINRKNQEEATEYIVDLIRKYLNICNNSDIYRYISITNSINSILFKKTKENLSIVTESREAFFDIKIVFALNKIFAVFFILSIISCQIGGLSSSVVQSVTKVVLNYLGIFGCLGSILSILLISFSFFIMKLIDRKISFSIDKEGIKCSFKNKTIFISKDQVSKLEIVSLNSLNEFNLLILTLKDDISLEPIMKKKMKKFNLFGNVSTAYNEELYIIYREIKQMLDIEDEENIYVDNKTR